MLLVISPAKHLDESRLKLPKNATQPTFQAEGDALAAKLKALSPLRLRKLMDISPALAELNHGRYQGWEQAVLKPAVHLFNGEAYRGLDAQTLDAGDLAFAQRHLRMLSGLYGVLRPLDLIAPHRLEMGVKLAMGRGKKDLYAFWGDRITQALSDAMRENEEDVLVNLASAEYFRSVRAGALDARVITPVFKERSAKGLKMVAVFAKRQRGALARWVIKHRLADPEGMKRYDGDGYAYEPEGSSTEEWLFVR